MVPKLRFKEFCGEWEEKKLKDEASFLQGLTYSPSDVCDNGILVLRSSNIQDNKILYTDNVFVNKKLSDSLFVKENDVLICVRNGSKRLVGKTALITKKDLGHTWGAFMMIIRSYSNNTFIYHYLNSELFTKQMFKDFGTATINQITKKMLTDCSLNIPSLPEQTKIADFLSTVDDKIQNQQDKITHLEIIKKGFMQKIFSRKIRFKDDGGEEFPEWEEKKLGDICKIIGGGTPDTSKSEYWGGNIPWFTPSEIGVEKYIYKSDRTITEYGLNKSSAKILPKGTILLSSRATIGEMSIARVECCTNQGFQSLVINNENSNEYIYYLKDKIKLYSLKNSYGSTFLEISKSNLEKCKVPIPCLKEQQKIANFLSSFDQKISTEKEKLKHLKQLKKGLLQRMFV